MWSYSQDLRGRVIAAVGEGVSARSAAARFKVSPSTAIKWVQRQRAEGSCARRPMGPAPGGGVLAAERDFLNALMEASPDITLAAVQDRLRAERGQSVGLATLSRFYRREGWRFKKKPARGRTRPA